MYYTCKNCGRTQLGFTLKCRFCFAFLTLEPVKQEPKILTLDQIDLTETEKFSTPLDKAIGPIPSGSMTVLAGVPGAGKSTLALQIANSILQKYDLTCLYISSEEPPEMIKQRALRVAPELTKTDKFLLLCETSLEIIKSSIQSITENFNSFFLILDSINAVKSTKTNSAPGSPSNIIKTLNLLHTFRTKQKNLTILIIAHANKQRAIAGPLTLQHMVDITLFFDIEKDETPKGSLGTRTLSVLKNRFSPSGIKITLDPLNL